jgi:hypothetical protein
VAELGWHELFRRFDQSGDGVLDLDEWIQAFRSIGVCSGGGAPPAPLAERRGGAAPPGNGSSAGPSALPLQAGGGGGTEAAAEPRAEAEHSPTAAEMLAQARAKSGGGGGGGGGGGAEQGLTGEEAQMLLEEQTVSERDLREVFGMLDSDHSGGIDAGEFLRSLRDEVHGSVLGKDGQPLGLGLDAFANSLLELAEFWTTLGMRQRPSRSQKKQQPSPDGAQAEPAPLTETGAVHFLRTLFGMVTEYGEANVDKRDDLSILDKEGIWNYTLKELDQIEGQLQKGRLPSKYSRAQDSATRRNQRPGNAATEQQQRAQDQELARM